MSSFMCIILLKTYILLSQFNPQRLKRLQPQEFWGGIGKADGELGPPQVSGRPGPRRWEDQASVVPATQSASALHPCYKQFTDFIFSH